ncbi:MAG: hypothetical protein HS108_03815 [Planctomycetes bacterium]|nr:hypothetical protein [Planctomycetota bacterium]MCL4729319.1 hypothetical protein [Planctomycetota bacterium]
MRNPTPKAIWLVTAGLALLGAAIAVSVFVTPVAGDFPWGIHIVTIPAVALVGVVIGWVMRDRQAAEEQAKAEVEKKN